MSRSTHTNAVCLSVCPYLLCQLLRDGWMDSTQIWWGHSGRVAIGFPPQKKDKVGQGVVHVHHDPHLPHVQGQAHVKVQESHEAHQIDQHEQEGVLDALISV
jgi:hypothetical protein